MGHTIRCSPRGPATEQDTAGKEGRTRITSCPPERLPPSPGRYIDALSPEARRLAAHPPHHVPAPTTFQPPPPDLTADAETRARERVLEALNGLKRATDERSRTLARLALRAAERELDAIRTDARAARIKAAWAAAAAHKGRSPQDTNQPGGSRGTFFGPRW